MPNGLCILAKKPLFTLVIDTFAEVAVRLMAIAIFACVAPTRRAAQVDPTNALRHE